MLREVIPVARCLHDILSLIVVHVRCARKVRRIRIRRTMQRTIAVWTTASRGHQSSRVRGQYDETNSLQAVVRATAKLWRKHHLTYDQTKYVVEQARRSLQLAAPQHRRRTVDRLDRAEVDCLIEAAYRRSSRYGLMIKTLFYTGARVSEFVHIQVPDLYLSLTPPQIFLAHAKGGSDGYVPILPVLAQELRTHLGGRRRGYLFESNRVDKYTPRYVQRVIWEAAQQAGIANA